MVSVQDFRDYMGYFRDPEDAKGSIGLLLLTRTNPTGTVVPIPSDLIYMASGQSFNQANRDVTEINESQLFVEISVQARHAGPSGNIDADQVWTTNQNVNFTATNPNPFSKGQDAKLYIHGIAPLSTEGWAFSNERLQGSLNVGMAVVRQLAGDSTTSDNEFFDNPLLKEAVYLVAMYRVKNSNTNETSSTMGDEGLKSHARQFFNDRAFLPLMTQVEILISQSGKRNLSMFFDGYNFEPTNSQTAKF